MALTAVSSLIQVYNDISTLCQNITDTNLYPNTGIQPGGVPSFFGAEYIMQNASPPLWLWVPISEQGGPPVFGGQMLADQNASFPYSLPLVPGEIIGSNAAPTPLCSRNSMIAIHCWGADGTSSTDPSVPYQNAETLLNIFVQQAYFYASPMSVKYEGGAFDQVAEFTRAGRIYTAKMLFRFPIVQTYTRATVAQYPLTPEIEQPSSLLGD